MNVAVIGGGIGGLAAAFRLSAAHDVTVFERAGAPGGKIRTERIGEYTFEWGPNGFLSGAAELRELVREAGLDDALTEVAPAASKRFVYWRGRLHALPAKPPRALGMSLLSPLGKLRALGDLLRRARTDDADESVYAFAERRFGREAAERIVAPALLGVSGGDARTTSAAALFPRLVELERRHGSVIRGMVRARTTPGRLTTFGAAGLQRLTDRLAELLGERLRIGRAVERIEPHGSGWRVVHRSAAGADETLDADAVIVATPAYDAARLVEGFDERLAAELRTIPYAPMRVAAIAFRAQDVPVPLDGFGFLAARGHGVRSLGVLYTSTIFPDQAPEGVAYLRAFLGGATDPDAIALDPEAAQAVVRADLAKTLGITAQPLAYHETLWPDAIPQYGLGHRALVARVDALASAHPRFALAGNAYRGLGLGDVVRDALAVAARLG